MTFDRPPKGGHYSKGNRRIPPRPGRPAAHVRIYLALLPSGPDAVHRLKLHRFRAAVQSVEVESTTLLHRHSGGEEQVLREHLADHDSEKIDVQNSRGGLRRADLRGLPRQVRQHGRTKKAEQDSLPEEYSVDRKDVAAEARPKAGLPARDCDEDSGA